VSSSANGAREPLVLVVDDDDDFAEAVGLFLARHGFAVRMAENARHGLELARADRPALVLMDVMMEERTAGFFAIQELRRDPRTASIPVLVVSSIFTEVPGFRVTPEADWLRHDGFLAKPVDFDLLLERVQALTGAGGPARAAAQGSRR
jgi:twitching motility two-component system response regulator PilH